MAEGEHGDASVKEALHYSLINVLSSNPLVRNSAEKKIQALEVTEDFGIYLIDFLLDTSEIVEVRQLASVLLKQYIKVHWNQSGENFMYPEVNENSKQIIKSSLLHALKIDVNKIRSTVACAISIIAHWDWPEHWPEFLEILLSYLSSENANIIHGTMRVLTEFARDVADTQVFQIVPVLLPNIYKIISGLQCFTTRTRGRAVKIFCTFLNLICSMQEVDQQAVHILLDPLLPNFITSLIQTLEISDRSVSDEGLKAEILQAFSLLVKQIPQKINMWIYQIINIVWSTLTQTTDVYLQKVIYSLDSYEEDVDSDGEGWGLENLIINLFEFVECLLKVKELRKTVQQGLSDLLYYLLAYLQITSQQINIWESDSDNFADDENNGYSYSLRLSAKDLIVLLQKQFVSDVKPSLLKALQRHFLQADEEKSHGCHYWWKIHEACFLALGIVKNCSISKFNFSDFDVDTFLINVVIPDLSASECPFLISRCLWLIGCYLSKVQPSLQQQLLQAVSAGLHQENSIIYVGAVRAVYEICTQISYNQEVFHPYLNTLLEGLLKFVPQCGSSLLTLILEALSLLLQVDDIFTACAADKIVSVLTSVFLKYNNDPVIAQLIQNSFCVLSKNVKCQYHLHQQIIPILSNILETNEQHISSGIQSLTLEIVEMLIRNCHSANNVHLLNCLFPSAVQCILNAQDSAILQNGGECIRAFISVFHNYLASERQALEAVCQVIMHLLSPNTSEHAALFVERLISVFVHKLGPNLNDHIDQLLKAVLCKLQRVQSLNIEQSLLMIFAHLVHLQYESLIDFLAMVPGPTGTSALEFVVIKWCARQHFFYGSYERKVSTLALCKLLKHALLSNNTQLQSIVTQDQVLDDDGILTRKQRINKPLQWKTLPLLAKLFKLIIGELDYILESKMALSDNREQIDSDSEYDDEDDWCNVVDKTYEESDNEDDPDVLSDPLFCINLEQSLTEFLIYISEDSHFSLFITHLNSREKCILREIGLHVT